MKEERATFVTWLVDISLLLEILKTASEGEGELVFQGCASISAKIWGEGAITLLAPGSDGSDYGLFFKSFGAL